MGEVALDDGPSLAGVLVGRLMETHLWPLGDLDGDSKGGLALCFVKRSDGSSTNLIALEADPAPIALGLDAIACLGDLDLDGTGELGIAGSRL